MHHYLIHYERYGTAFFVFPIYVTQVPENILRELLIHDLVRLKLRPPFQRLDQHRLGILDVKLPMNLLAVVNPNIIELT